MDSDLTIRQNSMGYSRTFLFGAEKLTVTMRDPSGECQFSVPYQNIDVASPGSLSMRNSFIKNATIATVLGLFLVSMCIEGLHAIASIAGTIVGIAFFVMQTFGLLMVRFISLPMTPPPAGISKQSVTIISGGNCDLIAGEIKLRWRDSMKALYGVANLRADPKQEEGKLQWLKDRGVLSDAEFSEQMQRLHSLRDGDEKQHLAVLN